MRSLVLLGGMVLILPQGGFAQAPPSAEVSAAQAHVAKYPNAVSPYINLAHVYVSENHPDEAIAAANHALAMEYETNYGTADQRTLAYDALTIAYLQKGDISNALSQVDAGLSRYPGSPLLSNKKGIVLIASGQYSRASEVLSSALASVTHISDPKAFAVALNAWGYVSELDKIDFGLGYNLVVSQYYAGQYPQALESARQLVALHDLGNVCVNPELIPGTKDICNSYTTEHLDNQVFADGHEISIMSRDIDYTFQYFRKGPVGSVAEFTRMRKNKEYKVQIVRQAVPLTASDTSDFALLALTLDANGDREQALAMAQKAIALDPNNFWSEYSYGLVLEDSNRLDEALNALETTTPHYSYPFVEAQHQSLRQIHRAVLYARKGDMAKAQEIYLGVANNIDPHCVPAVKEKDAFLALVQPMVDAHLTKAKQLDAQGKYAVSLPEYAQALSFAANDLEASTLRAAMFAASGKMPTPPEMPDEAHRHIVRGELMLNQGMLERGLAEFNEALRIAPYMPKLYQNTAVIYGGLKQYGQAIRRMRLYLTAAPETPDARTAQDQITKWELQQEMEGKR
jgi:tetratricopeptide (TPR) repeat protein